MTETQLSTDYKSHVVVTFNNAHYFITPAQEIALQGASLDDMMNFEGSKVKVSTIGEIMTIEKYYETFPDRRPDPMATVKKVFPGSTVVDDGPSKMTMREHAQKYLDDHPNEDNPTTRFMRQQLKRNIGNGPATNAKTEVKYLTWQDRYYKMPLEMLENRTRQMILDFLKQSPADKLEDMKQIVTKHLEKEHSECNCPEVGTCRPAGLLAAIMAQLDTPKKVEKPPVKKSKKMV